MTTLAYDGTTIACDSGAMAGEMRIPWETRKLWMFGQARPDVPMPRYRAFCGCGEVQDLPRAAAYYVALNKLAHVEAELEVPKPPLSDSFAGFVVGDHDVFTVENHLVLTPVRGIYARGSGRELALGALSHGASALEAVRIAIHWMPSHAFPIEWFNVHTGEWGRITE
jgi:hypothetical protein